jgi:hypothetical protein
MRSRLQADVNRALGRRTGPELPEYERLHWDARRAGLQVLLRYVDGAPVELGLGNGIGVDLDDLKNLEQAARIVRDRLAREIAR